jgi:dipeptidyl aminopeptidase/acylaminoacyl peptidase
LEFEGAIKWDMGNLEVSDQIAAVQVLVAEGLVDPNRVRRVFRFFSFLNDE